MWRAGPSPEQQRFRCCHPPPDLLPPAHTADQLSCCYSNGRCDSDRYQCGGVRLPVAVLPASGCPSLSAGYEPHEPETKATKQRFYDSPFLSDRSEQNSVNLALSSSTNDTQVTQAGVLLLPELSSPSPDRSPAAPPSLTGSAGPQTPADGGSCLSAE